MKKRKRIAAGLALLILLQLLTGCAAIRYGATLYSDTEEWLDDAFLEKNKIRTAYYRNPDFTDIHGSEPKYIQYPDEPKRRSFIITEKEEYDKIFTQSPIEVDFENEMAILYTSSDTNQGIREYHVKTMDIVDGALTVGIRVESSDKLDSVQPYQRWFVLVMKKMEINEVKFEEIRR